MRTIESRSVEDECERPFATYSTIETAPASETLQLCNPAQRLPVRCGSTLALTKDARLNR